MLVRSKGTGGCGSKLETPIPVSVSEIATNTGFGVVHLLKADSCRPSLPGAWQLSSLESGLFRLFQVLLHLHCYLCGGILIEKGNSEYTNDLFFTPSFPFLNPFEVRKVLC